MTARRLLPATAPEVAAAVRRVATGSLLVDLDLVVAGAAGEARLRARHALDRSTVHTFVRAESGAVEIGRLDIADWPAELARTCRVAVPAGAPQAPVPDLALPWDVLVGTGAALAQHRFDLLDVVLGRAAGCVTAGGRPLTPAATHEQVCLLHRSVAGRLRVVGTVPRERRVGWLCWLLFADGWRELTPYAEASPCGRRPMVRCARRTPDDLARGPARWAGAVRR